MSENAYVALIVLGWFAAFLVLILTGHEGPAAGLIGVGAFVVPLTVMVVKS